jgi:cytochrome P450
MTTADQLSTPGVDPGLDPDAAIAHLFFSEDGIDDPVPYYHHLRRVAPVHRSATGAIFLTRFDDCQRILRDNRFGKAGRRGSQLVPESDPEALRYRAELLERAEAEQQPQSMLFLNPPDHTRQRSLVQRAFTPKRVEQLRSSIRRLADEAVDRVVEARRCDLLELLAFPLPVAVIGTMVGVPEADWTRFRSLITTSAAGIEPGASVDDLRAAERSNAEVWSYFVDLARERRTRPRDDLLSDLIAVEEAGDQLSEGEVIAVAILLFAAGFETTTNLIGNGVGALLRHPDQMTALWADPTPAPSAVEEVLRWDSPVQLDVRTALEAGELDGAPIEAGQHVVTLLGAANRDPARFTDPDRFDITRDEGAPLSFAAGIHHCLGANLARVEGTEVFRSLVERCASIDLDGELHRRPRMTLRGYRALPISVTPR